MAKITGSIGVMPPECQVCFDEDADWEFKRGDKDSFFICNDCSRAIVNHLINHFPEEVDLPYIFYLRTSREMQKNEESQHIQNIIKEGLEKLDKYKKEEVKE